jgi:hypothetical protein
MRLDMDKKNTLGISFSIIKHFGTPNDAVTVDGIRVHRQEKVFVLDAARFIMCAPYDNHFIYLDTSKKVGRWFAMCTCGSPAVIVGYNAYKKDSSPTSGVGISPGEMLVCHIHASFGKHADGST